MTTRPQLSEAVLGEINRAAIPLSFDPEDYDPLLDWIGTRRVVLLGESSHGTHDFYRERAAITRRLIEEKGFNAIAIEGDWPDAHRVHRFLTGRGPDSNARDALGGFQRFPAWMWRNMDVLALLDWLQAFNSKRPRTEKVGFYGLDLYSLHASMRAVLDYLDKVDPEAAQRARSRYGCFDHFGEDPQAYGYSANFDLSKGCTDEVVAQLVELERRSADLAMRDGHVDPEDYLTAEQNARLVQKAEHYYRTMFSGGAESWNVRDRHMSETLEWLLQVRPAAKVVVWAHNSHLGDARGTEMSERGEVNLGQLARERYGDEVFALGFTTHSGEVTAASAWDEPAERRIVRPALRDSYEALFHDTQIPVFLLPMHDSIIQPLFDRPRLQRAIGVVYAPESERISRYFHGRMSAQFDAVIHIDRTKALVPFERTSTWATGEMPETYPYAV
ncbi:MAG: erythromycin esterase family protein [Acidobacteriota bacterium]